MKAECGGLPDVRRPGWSKLSLTICLAIVFSAARPCAAEQNLALPEVLDRIEAHLRDVKDVRFSYVVTTRFQDAKHTVLTEKYEIAWDQQERQRVKRTDEGGGTVTVTWDGKHQRYSVEGIPRFPFSRTTDRQPSELNYESNPLNTSLRFLGPDTLSRIRKLKSELVRVEEQGNDRVYAVRFEMFPENPGKGENSTTVWFSALHSFSPIKRVVVFDGAPWSETTVPELKEVSPGIWMPLKAVCKATPSGGQTSMAEAIVNEESLAVNTNLPLETFDIKSESPGSDVKKGPAVNELAPQPVAPEKLPLRILYAGHPGSEQEKDFVAFLRQHFVQVETGDLASFTDTSADGFDVAILNYDGFSGDRPKFPPRPRLSQNYRHATLTIGAAGGFLGGQLQLKTGYE